MSRTPVRWLLAAAALAAVGLVVPTLPAAARVSATGAFPAHVSTAGGSVTVAAKPIAIVSLSSTATEMLYSIGAGSQVKAVDSFSDFPKGTPETKLNAENPNVEAIVAYKPDLVVISSDTDGLSKQLAKFGIPVILDPAATDLAQEYHQFDELGVATGHAAQARNEVAKIRRQISRIVQATPHGGPPKTYYFELTQMYYSVTSSTFIGQVLGLLNLKSIADAATGGAASGGYPQLSSEYIIKSNPDFIFLADIKCCGQSARTVAKRPGWAVLSAVTDHHVVGINDDIASRWGPRIVDLLGKVADAVSGRH
jgi:iron complex transport system substrate-binding protein